MTTYYVTPIGDDRNSGLKPGSRKSLRTISKALEKGSEGDVVFIRRDSDELSNVTFDIQNLTDNTYFVKTKINGSGELDAVDVNAVIDYNFEDIPTEEELLEEIRKERNVLLYLTDWSVTSSSDLTSDQITACENYRQALRDLPNEQDIWNPDWPKPPQCLEDSVSMKHIFLD